MKTDLITFAQEHPLFTTCVGLVCVINTYKLADKLIDQISLTVNHAIDAEYSFETPKVTFKARPAQRQLTAPQ